MCGHTTNSWMTDNVEKYFFQNPDHNTILKFSDFRHNTKEPLSLNISNATSPEDEEKSDDTSDDSDTIALLVEDKQVKISRVLLGTASPVMKAMMSSPFRESRTKDVLLPRKTFASVKFMVDFVESPDTLEITGKSTFIIIGHPLTVVYYGLVFCEFKAIFEFKVQWNLSITTT